VPCEISRDRDADQNEHITIRIGHVRQCVLFDDRLVIWTVDDASSCHAARLLRASHPTQRPGRWWGELR
jgi:hypothetical protein